MQNPSPGRQAGSGDSQYQLRFLPWGGGLDWHCLEGTKGGDTLAGCLFLQLGVQVSLLKCFILGARNKARNRMEYDWCICSP